VPFPLLAHQAPVLPLKLWRSGVFSAVALCAGSIVPDLEYVRRPVQAGIGHSFLGQFVFCLPLSVAITWLVARFVGPALASTLPRSARWRFEDLGRVASPFSSRQRFGMVAVSALVGSFSHVLLDAFTHQRTWACRLLPVLERSTRLLGEQVPITTELQFAFSVVGALVAVPLFDRVLARRPGQTVPAAIGAAGRGRGWLLFASAAVPAAITAALSRGLAKEPSLYFVLGRVYVWGYIAFRACCAGFVGLAVAAVAVERNAKA
jgi:hypothetical protein